MKAAVLNAFNGKFQIETVEISEPQGREVLVDVKAAGMCHSDLHMASHDYGTPLPAVMGHEVAGIVRKVGPDVTEFAVGDHVTGSLIRFCGECDNCRGGETELCYNQDATLRSPESAPRLSRNGEPVFQCYGMGGFAEQALIHENQLAKIPVEIPFPQASILSCGCLTGAGAVLNTAGVRIGETVAVVGVGGVGLNAVSGARLAGARTIIAIDTQPAKKDLATKFGATHFIDASSADVEAEVRKILPLGVDHSFEAVGLKQTVRHCLTITRVGGSVNIMGLFAPGGTIELDPSADIIAMQRTIRGVMMGSCRIKRDIPMLADLYLQGRFNLDDLVSRTLNISEINEAYEEQETGSIARNVITSF